MKKKTLQINLLLFCSIAFFLVASAFTLPSSHGEGIEGEVYFGCYTCDLDSDGAPTGCAEAQFCGMSNCGPSCNLYGSLCGECEGD